MELAETFIIMAGLYCAVHVVLGGREEAARLDEDGAHSLNAVNTRLAALEERLIDQHGRLSAQELTLEQQEETIRELSDRLLQQEEISDLARKQQELTINQQQATIQELLKQQERHNCQEQPKQQAEESRKEIQQPKEAKPRAVLGEKEGRDKDAVSRRSDDNGPLENVVNHMAQQLTDVTSQIQALQNVNAMQDAARGTAYVRWGHAACPAASRLVYTGIMGGSHHTGTGGAANHLCLTSHPVFDSHRQPYGDGFASIYGSEYEICPEAECNLTPACAVCQVPRATSLMIPATNICPSGWSNEYSGYIMAGYPGYSGSSEFVCVDSSHGHYANSSQKDDNQNLINYTHTKCGALPCPPYQNDTIVTCVVCSK